MLEPHEAAKNTSAFLPQHVLNDAMSAFIGFTCGNLLACDYIYKRRIYIVERLHFEKQSNYNRYNLAVPNSENGGQLPDEYPFAEYVSLTDKDIQEDRMHPHEVTEHTDEMRGRMDKIHQDYNTKKQLQQS